MRQLLMRPMHGPVGRYRLVKQSVRALLRGQKTQRRWHVHDNSLEPSSLHQLDQDNIDSPHFAVVFGDAACANGPLSYS